MNKNKNLFIIYLLCVIAVSLLFFSCSIFGDIDELRKDVVKGTKDTDTDSGGDTDIKILPGQPFTLVFNKNGGDGSMAEGNFKAGEEQELPPNAFTRRSHIFKGWATSSTGKVEYNDKQIVTLTPEGETVTLWAVWELIKNVPGNNLAAKFSWLDSNAISDVEYTVEVNVSGNLALKTLSYGDYSNVVIHLKSVGGARTLTLDQEGFIFKIESGVTLVLEEITLQGFSDNNTAFLIVNAGAELIIDDGSKITGNFNNNSAANGGGIIVKAGTLTLNSGEISNNHCVSSYGGAVYITDSGTFTMNDGTIRNNSAYEGGGVYIDKSSFFMKAGAIKGNSAASSGGGVRIENGIFEKDAGALITGVWNFEANTADGDWDKRGGGHAVFAMCYQGNAAARLWRDSTSNIYPLLCRPSFDFIVMEEDEDPENSKEAEGWMAGIMMVL